MKKFNLLGKIFFLFLIVLGGSFWAGLSKAKAADSDVVISEVMANPAGSDTNREWIELTNFGTEKIDLVTWQLQIYSDPSDTIPKRTVSFNSLILNPDDILVITSNADIYKPCDNCLIYDGKFSSTAITNAKGKIALIDIAQGYKYDFSWNYDVGQGISMEIIGPPVDPTFIQWHPSLSIDGTPGAKNSVSKPPFSPILLSPANMQIFTNTQTVNFLWQNSQINLTYEFKLSTLSDLTQPIIDEPDLDKKELTVENLDPGIYYWQVIADSSVYQTSSSIFSFTLLPPVYSNAIIINELLPDPVGDDAAGEWIELYNNSAERVNLKGWKLQDTKGSISSCAITDDLWIEPFGYLLIWRNISGITLNNDIDSIQLYQPDGTLLFTTPEFDNSVEGLAWARGPDGVWSWTDQVTPEQENIIHLPSIDNNSSDNPYPLNSDPIEISTGDTQNYLDYLVQITGEVIETSGDTFYIDDGSGVIKIYIQSKTGIKKPTMRTGDVFQIIGIVDFYRGTWRILPQTADDIKLIKATLTTKQAKAKQAAKKTATKIISAVKPKSVLGEAKAANSNEQSSKIKESNFLQFIELVTSLAFIFLVVLIVRLRRVKKPKVIGGDFGNDFT